MKKIYLLLISLAWISCQSEQSDPAVNCNTYDLEVVVENVVDATCANEDGEITIRGVGGTGNYQYLLNGQEQGSAVFTNLAPGNYTVAVSDGNCTVNAMASVNNADGLSVESVGIVDSGCGSSNGSITLTTVDGVQPVLYSLDGSSPQESNVFAGLGQGIYEVVVSDQTGCEVTQEVFVPSGESYAGSVQAIIENNCTLASCHGGNQPPDFRQFSNIQSNADRIRARTQNGTMPPNSTLDQSEIDAIACWVDDGALDN